jgi:hypothetical protein
MNDWEKKELLGELREVAEWLRAAPSRENLAKLSILSMLRGRPEGASEQEIERLCNWITGVLVDVTTLSLLVGGSVAVRFVTDDADPEVRLTSAGHKATAEAFNESEEW